MSDFQRGQMFLGYQVDPASAKATDQRITLDARDLTTHAVIVGMTGSGKTGLGVVMLEEALRSGVPTLVLDPKGDMTNLALNFPDLRPADFQPWVNAGDAEMAGLSVPDFAAKTAVDWKNGLAAAGIAAEQMRQLKVAAPVTIYTPGSSAGIALNILGSLNCPALSWDTEAEALRDEIEGFVTSLLGLADVPADPLSSREFILLANLVETAWRSGQDLDLAMLIGQVQQPPLRKLGVFDLETFFPAKDRLALAMRLNGLVASPSFASWLEGAPLDIDALLRTAEGKPRCAVVYLAHLSDQERLSVVTLILAKLVTWMRGQSGTTDLRALCYMDELYGFAPPNGNPPSKKPLLTLLKQARAFGVGMVLATQNPVDLDYKALSNAGTWFIGRLQTEQDKARMLDGLQAAVAGTDIGTIDKRISGLAKRQFLMHQTKSNQPLVLATRWAISYLRGPLTKEQIATLMADAPERRRGAAADARAGSGSTAGAATSPIGNAGLAFDAATAPIGTAAVGADTTPVMPPVVRSVPVYYMDAAAPWAGEVGAQLGGKRLQAGLVARVQLRYDDAKAGIDQREEWEAVFVPLGRHFDASTAVHVDYDSRDLLPDAPAGAVYVLPEAPLNTPAYFTDVAGDIRDYLVNQKTVETYRNAALKLFARPGETRDAFLARCDLAVQAEADREAAAYSAKLQARVQRLQDAIAQAQQRRVQLDAEARSRDQQTLITGAGALLGALLGGRRSVRSIASGINSVSAKHATAARADMRVQDVDARVSQQQAELAQLEEELAGAVTEIDARWKQQADAVDTLQIGLEKTDVSVEQVAVVWIPVA